MSRISNDFCLNAADKAARFLIALRSLRISNFLVIDPDGGATPARIAPLNGALTAGPGFIGSGFGEEDGARGEGVEENAAPPSRPVADGCSDRGRGSVAFCVEVFEGFEYVAGS